MSGLKQLAAWNYEDMLQVLFSADPGRKCALNSFPSQCALAVFEGLFPGDHDLRVQNLLFSMAHWHALAKLRMHTDLSLDVLDHWTTILGEDARTFVELTCSEFRTKELLREYQARKRRQSRKASRKGAGSGPSPPRG